MADILTASGTQIWLGPQADNTVTTSTAFAALTPYVPILMVETYGEFGDEASAVNFSAVGDGRVRKGKGAKDAGTLPLTVGYLANDPGQLAVEAALASPLNFAIKIQLPDQLTSGGTGTIVYFRGLIMSKRRNIGGNDNIIRRTFNIGINSALVEVAAT